MNAQELFEVARDNAARIFKKTGEVLPMWHAIDGNDEHMLIPTPWDSREEKEDIVAGLRVLFEVAKVQRYAMVCEAWIVEVKIKDNDINEVYNTIPSKHPDRREVVRIVVEDRNGKMLSGQYFILRPEHGPPTLSPFHTNSDDCDFGGMMSNMLGTERTKH